MGAGAHGVSCQAKAGGLRLLAFPGELFPLVHRRRASRESARSLHDRLERLERLRRIRRLEQTILLALIPRRVLGEARQGHSRRKRGDVFSRPFGHSLEDAGSERAAPPQRTFIGTAGRREGFTAFERSRRRGRRGPGGLETTVRGLALRVLVALFRLTARFRAGLFGAAPFLFAFACFRGAFFLLRFAIAPPLPASVSAFAVDVSASMLWRYGTVRFWKCGVHWWRRLPLTTNASFCARVSCFTTYSRASAFPTDRNAS